MEALILENQQIFEKFTKLHDLEKSVGETDWHVRRKFVDQTCNIDARFSLFEENVRKLNALRMKQEKAPPDCSSIRALEDLYDTIKGTRERILREDFSPASKTEPKGNHINLPPIHIPSFDGSPDNWPTFYELFRCNVHLNVQLSNAQKVQYLISKLTHDALNIVAGVVPSGDTYDIIWDSLTRKYQDKRSMGSRYISYILEDKVCANTSYDLNKFVEKFAASVAALKRLDIPDLFDFVVLHCGLRRLNSQVIQQFESSVRSCEIPTSDDLVDFLRQSVRVLERSQSGKDVADKRTPGVPTRRQSSKGFKSFVSNTSISNEKRRFLCAKTEHSLSSCSKFLDLKSPQARSSLVLEKRGCVNCLELTHPVRFCSSKTSCRICGRKHHTLLHFARSESKRPVKPVNHSPAGPSPPSVSLSAGISAPSSSVLLATAQVHVLNDLNVKCPVRCLIDSGSQNNLITQDCCERLGLPQWSMHDAAIHGIGNATRPVRGHTRLTIESRLDPAINYHIQALILDKITSKLPPTRVNYPSYLRNCDLADPDWNVPNDVDLILGAQLFPQIYIGEKEDSGIRGPTLIMTKLGCVLMGDSFAEDTNDLSPLTFVTTEGLDLDTTLRGFFELEEVPSQLLISPEEQACEDIFRSTVKFEDDRICVDLPFVSDPIGLGNSRESARLRFAALERKFSRMPELRKKYNKTIQGYLDQGYLEEVSDSALISPGYYIPHHGVSRPDKEDVRVVLDASAKSSTGCSLNDILHTGPNLQADLFNLLLGFRLFPIAMTADIRQMFLQVGVNRQHHQYLRILYRFDEQDSVKTFHFLRVPFGLKSSPYLAMRAIRYLADRCGHRFGDAERLAKSRFYMDDFVHSTYSEQVASESAHNLIELLKIGSFDLIKWSSNSLELLRELPESHRSPVLFSNLDRGQDFKILGLSWDPVHDSFSFPTLAIEDRCTKRTILSMVARLFDVLGLVAPVILYAKLLIKELWMANLGWDDVPPVKVISRYSKLIRDLPNLSELRIPRHVGVLQNSQINLVAFCDASTLGYGSCIYLHVSDPSGGVSVRLLCAKSKVSPVKVTTLARLELVAALLSSRLVRLVKDQLSPRIMISNTFIFSDSTIALSWIHSSPHRWAVFVGNRVSKIHENLSPDNFYHVSGRENPSDCLSRGMLPSELLSHSLWWEGPKWLYQSFKDWPQRFFPTKVEELPELKVTSLLTSTPEIPTLSILAQRIGSWEKMIGVFIVILKFIKQYDNNNYVINRQRAETLVIRALQRIHFAEVVQLLDSGKLPSRKLRSLSIFLDSKRILRIGGRLSHSDLPFDAKHPILLPKRDPIVNLIIDYFHRRHGHAGPGLLVSIIRQQFWILDGRTVVRSRCRSCNTCFHLKPSHPSPVMADLPGCRISEAKAFVHTGVDLAGPLLYVPIRHRGQRARKIYICLFVCLSTKAIHLELVSDLTSDCFLAALKRFISRRGPISNLYSDNGTNFIGAKAQLNDTYSFLLNRNLHTNIRQELVHSRIEWKLIPPRVPHFGGLWEANVKSVKTHLYRVMGKQLLTYEELLTVLIQIEALLNSRPLCAVSSDPHPEILTPAHFLMSSPLKCLPSAELTEDSSNLHNRKRLLDQLVLSYWNRWRREYLHTLQVRQKWTTPDKPVTPGMVVLVEQDNIPPLVWPLGLITEVFPGPDRVIRVANVRTATGTYKRPVIKLYPLPTQ